MQNHTQCAWKDRSCKKSHGESWSCLQPTFLSCAVERLPTFQSFGVLVAETEAFIRHDMNSMSNRSMASTASRSVLHALCYFFAKLSTSVRSVSRDTVNTLIQGKGRAVTL